MKGTKSLYGLKLAPRACKKFRNFRRTFGSRDSLHSSTQRVSSPSFCTVATGLLICYCRRHFHPEKEQKHLVSSRAHPRGTLPGHRRSRLFFGVKIERAHGRVMLPQKAYLGNDLTRFGMTECISGPYHCRRTGVLFGNGPLEMVRAEVSALSRAGFVPSD
jgi:hypothetical protein